MIILDRKFSVNPDVICSESEDSTVLLYRDKLYVLNETATWLWFRILERSRTGYAEGIIGIKKTYEF